MTWNTLTNLSTGQVVTETHMDQIRENIEHLGAMLFGANAASALTAGSQLLYVVGTYTGDGATTKAITGVGFQPRFLWLYSTTTSTAAGFKTSLDAGGNSSVVPSTYTTDHIISLDSGGFTVGDGTTEASNRYNVTARVYIYLAFR